jgi:heme oxygenase
VKSGIAASIKRITAPEHVRAEETVTRFAPFESRARYAAYMCKLHAFYANVEPPLFRWLEQPTRRKLALIERDLGALGARARPERVALPRMPTLAHALGVGYVLEGKTLGSRFLLEEARTKLALDPSSGASFLAGYGPQTGAMWRDYLDTLTAHVAARGERLTIVQAARATFASFTAWIAA